MRKISDGIYKHRSYWITRDEQGISIEGFLELFPTWNDAKEFINKHLDGTNKKEPRIIGEWSEGGNHYEI